MTIFLTATIWYTFATLQKQPTQALEHLRRPNTQTYQEVSMSGITLHAPSPVVQIPNGDPGVVYREVVGFPDYAVGDDGSVWSKKTVRGLPSQTITWRKKGLTPVRRGRLVFSISNAGKVIQKYVHVAVLEAFVGPRPDGLEGCHWDDIGAHNNLGNLRWDTHQANQRDMVRNGHSQRGEKQRLNVLRPGHVKEIVERARNGESQRQLADEFHVTETTISNIIVGKTWSHLTGIVRHRRQATAEKVREVRKLIAAGARTCEIARALNMPAPTVSQIRTGITWRHVN